MDDHDDAYSDYYGDGDDDHDCHDCNDCDGG